jgi:hypothetical protein
MTAMKSVPNSFFGIGISNTSSGETCVMFPQGRRATVVHNAHRIEMRGESKRKKRNPPQDEKRE